ncbi:MAG: PIN domain-containing protein [Lachnospiraceae bacterium]|nr:PIN domain-containing protein [Lachnospiraceae bacterium]
MKILIDTNVVIDALLSREPYNKSANDIFTLSANHIVEMYITASSVTYIYHLLEKNLDNNDTAKQMLGKLYTLAHVLEVTESDCKNALNSQVENYEYALITQVAKRCKFDFIISRNGEEYKEGKINTITPDEFVKIAKGTC